MDATQKSTNRPVTSMRNRNSAPSKFPIILNFERGTKSIHRPAAAMWPRNSAGFGRYRIFQFSDVAQNAPSPLRGPEILLFFDVAEYFKFWMWSEIDSSQLCGAEILMFLTLPNILNFGCDPKSTHRPVAAMWPRNSALFDVSQYFKFRMWPEIDSSARRRYVAPEFCWFLTLPNIPNFGCGSKWTHRPVTAMCPRNSAVFTLPNIFNLGCDAKSIHRTATSLWPRNLAVFYITEYFKFWMWPKIDPAGRRRSVAPQFFGFSMLPNILNFGCGQKPTHRPAPGRFPEICCFFYVSTFGRSGRKSQATKREVGRRYVFRAV